MSSRVVLLNPRCLGFTNNWRKRNTRRKLVFEDNRIIPGIAKILSAPINLNNLELAPISPRKIDITKYIHLSQAKASKKIGITVSMLRRKWEESNKNRKWPCMDVKRIDSQIRKEIDMQIEYRITRRREIEALNAKKKELLRPAFIIL